MGAGLVVEEKSALGIGANSERRLRTLGDKLRRRTSNRCEQPIEAAFARDEFHTPGAIFENQFIMTLGDSKDFVNGPNPLAGDFLLPMHGRKGLAKRSGELPGF